jgi:hypothetical protein
MGREETEAGRHRVHCEEKVNRCTNQLAGADAASMRYQGRGRFAAPLGSKQLGKI